MALLEWTRSFTAAVLSELEVAVGRVSSVVTQCHVLSCGHRVAATVLLVITCCLERSLAPCTSFSPVKETIEIRVAATVLLVVTAFRQVSAKRYRK